MAIRRRVSIKDVAARAGVNRSTVSRALRLDPRITAATTATVLEAARRLGYVPHSGARALATGKTQVVTVIVASLREVFVQLVLQGIEDALLKTSYRLRIETAHSGIYSPSSGGAAIPAWRRPWRRPPWPAKPTA